MPTISPSKRQQMKIGLARKREERRAWREQDVIRVEDWRIFRLDPYNFVLAREGEREENCRYYPTIDAAFNALLRETISEEARGDIRSVLAAVNKAEARLLAALQERR